MPLKVSIYLCHELSGRLIHDRAQQNESNEEGLCALNVSLLCSNQIFISVFKAGASPSLQPYKL